MPPESGPAASANGLAASWVRFWFSAIDPIGLHTVRVLACLAYLYWLLPLAGAQQALFGLGGWFDARAYAEASRLEGLPPHLFGWSVVYLCGTNPVMLAVVYSLSVVAIVLFGLGLWTRLTGALTWVAVVSYTASPAVAYDADPLLLMLAFYLMVAYMLLGQRQPAQSPAARLLGTKDTWLLRRTPPAADGGPRESVAANLALRLLQVHFAIAMVASGLHKLQSKEWWDGLATWFYTNPPFQTTMSDVRAYAPHAQSYLTLFSLASYAALAWQLGFPAFAWRRHWRPVLLGGALVAWVAGAFLPLPLFGPLVAVICLSYLTPEEWRRLASLLGRLPGASPLRQRLAGGTMGPATAGAKGLGGGKASAVSLG
jgi:hypothetical protein